MVPIRLPRYSGLFMGYPIRFRDDGPVFAQR